MDLQRLATAIINIFISIVFAGSLILAFQFACGEEAIAEEAQFEPAEVVEPVAAEVKEPEVVLLSCTVVQNSEPTYSEADLEMLSLAIYQEAGSDACSDETRMMVGNVVLNRVADDRFPDTIELVLLQERQYGRLHWTGLVWPERASYLSEAHAVERAYACAERLLNGERVFADDVIWQAEFSQGSEIVAQQDGFYFCR